MKRIEVTENLRELFDTAKVIDVMDAWEKEFKGKINFIFKNGRLDCLEVE